MAEPEQSMDLNLNHKKSGWANVQDPAELNPDGNFPIGDNGRRLTFDEF